MTHNANHPVILPGHRHRAFQRIANVKQLKRQLLIQQNHVCPVLQLLGEKQPPIPQILRPHRESVFSQQFQPPLRAIANVGLEGLLIHNARERIRAYVAAQPFHYAVQLLSLIHDLFVGHGFRLTLIRLRPAARRFRRRWIRYCS